MNRVHATEDPLVSIVVSTWDEIEKGYLQQALSSVCSQTRGDWECIIVGDATPHEDQIRRYLQQLGDARIRFVNRTRRHGRGNAAKNDGARLARGAYLCFLDADDVFTPDHVELLLAEFLRDSRTDLAFGDQRVFLEIGGRTISYLWRRPWSAKAERRLRTRCNLFEPSDVMIARSAFGATDGVPDDPLDDWRLWQSLMASGHGRFRRVPKVLTHYRTTTLPHYLFKLYLAMGGPLNMELASRLRCVPGKSALISWLYKRRAKAYGRLEEGVRPEVGAAEAA